MTLANFPRPPQDNGRGVHWSHSPSIWGKPDWGFWREQIQALQLKWVKMVDTGDGSSIGLAKRLIDLGVMPVVRFYRFEPNPDPISSREIEAAREYIAWGVVYFETNNEPDLSLEWKNGSRPDNWLEIVVNNFISEADIIRNLGGYLLFPAFGPGGRGNPFELIVKRGRRDILDGNCGLAIHNYALGRPLDYPNDPITRQGQPLTLAEWNEQGGTWAWEMDYQTVNQYRQKLANPQASIMEDSTCFRAFEYFDALVNQAVGHSIPIFTTEGGYNVGQRAGTTQGDDPRYPKPTPEWAGRLTEAMFRYMQTDAPDYYFACMPWLIAVSRIGNIAPAYENQGPWYTHQFDEQFGLKGELPIVPKLKALASQSRADGPTIATWARYRPDPNWVGRVMDARLKYLEPIPKLEAVLGTQVPSYWKLIEVQWADETEGQGYILVKALDEQGQPLEGVTFQVTRADTIDTALTKGAADQYWGNYLMTAPLGTYRVSMFEGQLPSDGLSQVGRGKEEKPSEFDNTSFKLTFQRVTMKALQNSILTLPQGFGGHGLAMSGTKVMVGGYKIIQQWDIATQQIQQMFKGHESWVWAIAMSPNEQYLASASWDKRAGLWDMATGRLIRQWTGHQAWVSCVAFNGDNSTVATGGADKTVRVWSIDSDREIRILTGHTFHVWAVAFHPDQQTLASGSGDKTIRLWDIFSGQVKQTFHDLGQAVLSVAFSPDGKLLAGGGADGLINLWDMATGQVQQTLTAPLEAVHSLAFSPDSKLLAASSLDKIVRVWGISSGQLQQQFRGHADIVRRVAFSTDGRMVASLGADETVRLWVV